MLTPRRGRALAAFWRLHRAIFQLSGGRVGGRIGRFRALMLTTIGRRSGLPARVMLSYVDDAGDPVVVASNAGDDRHPGWYLNLQAHPTAEILIGGESRRVRARTTIGEERERLMREFVSRDRSYAEYQRRTTRQLPVVVFEEPVSVA